RDARPHWPPRLPRERNLHGGMLTEIEEPGGVVGVAAAGGDDHDGVTLLHRRRQHDRTRLAALASRRRQRERGHPACPPSEAPPADLHHTAVESVDSLQLQIARHASNTTTCGDA